MLKREGEYIYFHATGATVQLFADLSEYFGHFVLMDVYFSIPKLFAAHVIWTL